MTLRLAAGTAWADVLAPRQRRARPRRSPPARPRNLYRRRLARRRHAGAGAHAGRRHRPHPPGPARRRHGPRRRPGRGDRSTASGRPSPLAERKARVTAALDALTDHRDLLALLLVWEIGKPWRLACADVDRALDGVRWYVDEIDRHGRRPRAAARPGQQHRVAGTTR